MARDAPSWDQRNTYRPIDAKTGIGKYPLSLATIALSGSSPDRSATRFIFEHDTCRRELVADFI